MQRVTRVSQAHAVFRVFVVSFDTATKSGLHLFRSSLVVAVTNQTTLVKIAALLLYATRSTFGEVRADFAGEI